MTTVDIVVLILFVIFLIWVVNGFNKTQFDKYADSKKKKKKKKKD